MNKKALIAMSGGVDSSVAAYITTRRGYDCVGATMKLFDNETIGISRNNEKSCCSERDAADARSVAYSLGIPFYVFNFLPDFKERVINKFIEAYQNGFTPNPCVDCNRYMKFEKLFERAKQLKIDYLVTGHYARIEKDPQSLRYLLKKAVDDTKDQSYALYSMTQEQLARTLFPLGELTKTQIRATAAERGFVNADKRDSQDICFVPNGDYAGFIENYTGKTCESGNFTDKYGNIIGRHKGIIRYTAGQRKGLGLSHEKPLYVLSKDARSNTVTLGENSDLFSKSLTAVDFNWIAFENPEPKSTFRVKAKVRYSHIPQPATATVASDNTVNIEFDEPQRAIAKGQSVVLYDGDDGDIVIGGGVIT